MQLDITTGNAIEIVSILGVGLGLFWRTANLIFELRELRKDIDALKPHGVSVPLLLDRVGRLETRDQERGKHVHKIANDVTYLLGRVDDLLGPREPSRPDLEVEGHPRKR